jgi:hypothetical protein
MASNEAACSLPYTHGRPDLAAQIAAMAPAGMKGLVFVSHAMTCGVM